MYSVYSVIDRLLHRRLFLMLMVFCMNFLACVLKFLELKSYLIFGLFFLIQVQDIENKRTGYIILAL
jgi:hypothetical protein